MEFSGCSSASAATLSLNPSPAADKTFSPRQRVSGRVPSGTKGSLKSDKLGNVSNRIISKGVLLNHEGYTLTPDLVTV